MNTRVNMTAKVPEELAGNRLDQIAAKLFPDYSRSRLQGWIKEGCLKANGQLLKPRDRLQAGDSLVIDAELEKVDDYVAEPIPLNVVFEDEHLLVLNKPTNTVVHPAAGHRDGTLLNGLLHRFPVLEELPRAGIVHRLDKDTTGLMVVAKSLPAHTGLVNQLQLREIQREYQAVVHGVLTGGGTVDKPLGRHPVNRKKRAVIEEGQEAVTHYRVINRFRSHTHIHVKLETGRTHQIRVHMAHINHSLVGDPLYGGRLQIPAASGENLVNCLKNFKRQALHAWRLSLVHPVTGESLSWEAKPPADFQELITVLKEDYKLGSAR